MTPSAKVESGAGSADHRAELWTLYRVAFEDRNFQVNLNWDRTKHYFIFNAALFGVAGGGALSRPVVLGLFALAFLNSLFAAHAIRRGHEYYRQTRRHLKEIERELGLFGEDPAKSPLALQSTRGMARDMTGAAPSLADRLTIVNASIALQLCIAAASALAFAHAW